ncbi:neural proliferation differentiation and control protein 1 [Oryzias melastigma]|uniref:neural proliferation differentiation and control protein 1 n=1 Tax=Oryzias melastigma TaxID=30732 RepID=UPI000CF81530|nr:neural proliferation differentiation and control protein 1 [Oryzias melastigma]
MRAAVFAALLAVGTCFPAGSDLCPRSLDCARAGRHFCQAGTSRCGPCLHPLVEDSRGHCIVRRRHGHQSGKSFEGKGTSHPELDEEIDFLSAIISEQRTESLVPAATVSQAQDANRTAVVPTSQAHLSSSWAPPTTTNHTPVPHRDPIILPFPSSDRLFVIISSVFIVAGALVLLVAGACWLRLQKGLRLSQKVDYPAYGLMRAQNFCSFPGDKKLAHNAQMYHYQHQKQQMLSLEKHRDEPKVPDSGASTDEENEDGDFTVYECPGLAPTGEMEVKNPLFDDSTLYLQRLHQ